MKAILDKLKVAAAVIFILVGIVFLAQHQTQVSGKATEEEPINNYFEHMEHKIDSLRTYYEYVIDSIEIQHLKMRSDVVYMYDSLSAYKQVLHERHELILIEEEMARSQIIIDSIRRATDLYIRNAQIEAENVITNALK